ncbi:PTS system, glucitol/sorbitol-specific, IIC component [Propionibacterium sp. oral taxon 192 str. F0372]|uniref:PTS glucitol/sorbitol transporter subunit IIC n=1 Tax=Propionibacterium sp. oral taxon 192 TaxID=671222 RepID=UPI000353CBD1|nr:PTS glucitol/sorbitol transporter subunit IIC [Propionibacterium sp. oral taxon 192]EPH06749.1 PTS system, glucitol/sorbitol-specific, IIC component [Propionibacterium sp. oral taxon 192 str. F0372]
MGDNPVMRAITWFAEHFIGLFNEAAKSFTSLATGIIPLLMVMLTAMYAITTWIGEERVNHAMQWAGRFAITRYTVMPFLAMLLLTNPMAYTFGRFLPERYKPAFYDATVSMCHPITSLFPHANAGEIFVWTGVSAGVMQVAPGKYATLTILYFLVGLVVIAIRGFATQWMTAILIKRGGHEDIFKKYDEAYASGHIQGGVA